VRRWSIADTVSLGRSEKLGDQIVAALGALIGFDYHWVRLLPSVVAHARNLPGHLHQRSVRSDLELVILNFTGHDGLRELPDNCQLVTEVLLSGDEKRGDVSASAPALVLDSTTQQTDGLIVRFRTSNSQQWTPSRRTTRAGVFRCPLPSSGYTLFGLVRVLR
jgi:hypothetical protein